ncbi:MAG: hypothetical protein R2932_44665, partial [Caldilineaceae bacterium]
MLKIISAGNLAHLLRHTNFVHFDTQFLHWLRLLWFAIYLAFHGGDGSSQLTFLPLRQRRLYLFRGQPQLDF